MPAHEDHPPIISVCLCTHSPRPDYLARTLAALRAQTLGAARWEMVIVDNAGEPPLAARAEFAAQLAALPNARLIVEPTLGLTPARLAAIAAARAPLLVFVDDDNLLAPDYLAVAARLFETEPKLGVAAGRIAGEFESAPPRWARRFLGYLALRDHGPRPIRSGAAPAPLEYELWHPCGAGMVIRRALAERYAARVAADPARLALGRRGDALAGSEDLDLVFTALKSGTDAGYCPELTLTHLIPAARLAQPYLRRLVYHSELSRCRMMRARGLHARCRPWPLEYLSGWAQCLLAAELDPRTLLIQSASAAARYAARQP